MDYSDFKNGVKKIHFRKGQIDFEKAKNFMYMCNEINGIGQKEQNWHNVKNI